MTGLIIGSIVPDFEYFIRMRVSSVHSHTLMGILWFNLPLAILLAFLFHGIVKRQLFLHLPVFLKTRLMRYASFSWTAYFKKHWLAVIMSILIGSASHLFWDSFTHEHGYFVELIAGLRKPIAGYPLYKLLQHGSTLIGGVIILLAILKLPIDRSEQESISHLYWLFFACISIVILGIRFVSMYPQFQPGNLIVSSISAAIVALIVTPLILRLIKR